MVKELILDPTYQTVDHSYKTIKVQNKRNALPSTNLIQYQFIKENHWKLNPEDYNMFYAKLEPGDTLCIPPWWWHAVDNDGYTCAVTKIYERNDIEYFDWDGFNDLKNRHRLQTTIPLWFTNFWRRIF